MKTLLTLWALATFSFSLVLGASSDSQQVALDQPLQIPGEVLPPGTYTFNLEDRMSGRAIIRVTSAATGRHSLLLSVPSAHVGANATTNNGLVLFTTRDAKQVLRAWLCRGSAKPLELVYPKDEAAQITAETAQSVLAADPSYDKLPADLSPDDMRVVTLWLLSPERISNNRGVGLKAARYVSPAAIEPVPTRSHLPQTASNIFSFAAVGLMLFLGFAILRVNRLWRERCAA